jgi:hypothetical protein
MLQVEATGIDEEEEEEEEEGCNSHFTRSLNRTYQSF